MSLVRLNIKGISYSQTHTGAYALVLSEVDGTRTLPIVIGAFEAQSIAISLEKEIKPPRPLTHDLFKNFADRFHIVITQVIIHKLVDGIFYSSIICQRDGIEEIIDTRTSDAIALATRFNAPIYTYENILEKAGVELKDKEEKDRQLEAEEFELPQVIEVEKPTEKKSSYDQYSLEELHTKLNDAVSHENYEYAANLRDEIEKRSSK
ncbi:MAG: hypothetical protein COB98_05815 [Flavobacteriaceae bacterium]|nr:MAG: hypothetical protein COB98_05815 [Flavobacteriaceae bacterium]